MWRGPCELPRSGWPPAYGDSTPYRIRSHVSGPRFLVRLPEDRCEDGR